MLGGKALVFQRMDEKLGIGYFQFLNWEFDIECNEIPDLTKT